MTPVRLSRRALLRGAGVALSLPALECMLGPHGQALAAGPALPLRYVLCFGGYSLRTDSGPPARFIPSATGPGYDLPVCLTPLGDLGVASEVTVASNLMLPGFDSESGDAAPPNGYSEFHWHGGPLLSGVTQRGTFDAGATAPTSDQIVADALGAETAFASLVYRAQAQYYNLSGGIDVPDNRDSPSFRDLGAGIAPVAPATSPQLAWQSLFTGFIPDDKTAAAAAELELRKRTSVLDLVDWRMSSVAPRLSASDQARLEQHWDHIRTLERRLDTLPPEPGTTACEMLADPGPDPALGGEFATPTGNDINLGYSDEDTRAEVFADLIAMALTCDRTRVVAWMITMWQSFVNAHPLTGHRWNSHELHHRGTQAQLEDLVQWHVAKWAGLVDRLRALPEGDGTVLDRCAVMLLNEGGASETTRSSHNTENMAFLLAGGAGGLRRGEHVRLASPVHAARLPLTAMHAVGVTAERLGNIAGPLPELVG